MHITTYNPHIHSVHCFWPRISHTVAYCGDEVHVCTGGWGLKALYCAFHMPPYTGTFPFLPLWCSDLNLQPIHLTRELLPGDPLWPHLPSPGWLKDKVPIRTRDSNRSWGQCASWSSVNLDEPCSWMLKIPFHFFFSLHRCTFSQQKGGMGAWTVYVLSSWNQQLYSTVYQHAPHADVVLYVFGIADVSAAFLMCCLLTGYYWHSYPSCHHVQCSAVQSFPYPSFVLCMSLLEMHRICTLTSG